ncbi:aldo/keto reductase [Priestia koreensis]|uniref:aldo/keto reductase n=1 Tax=Priestia koreensis TaxID=284581 RepID=UPI00203DD130|nr:aldo/keto reductase [Priestia koreensis]MCM3004221.1 aldo/keto reductase [Priestia koreensis]
MERVQLKEDLQFSRIIHGLWRLADWKQSDQETLALLEQCLELGITTFDNADIYGDYSCEELFGKALALKPELREKMELVTKCDIKLLSDQRPEHGIKHYDTSKKHIIWSAENSLKKLGVDSIDVLLIHRPDPLMDPAEVAEAFRQLKQDGKVKHFGVSNFLPSQFDMLSSYLDEPLVTNQIEISVTHLEEFHNGSIDKCLEKRIAPMAWSPLAGGRIFSGDDERSTRVRQTLEKIAGEVGAASIDQVMYAWLLRHPANIMPIVGSGKIERVKSAVEALNINLTREQWFDIWTSSLGHEVA